jgi:uncharacterized Zn-binding protein involved in type VI secretion
MPPAARVSDLHLCPMVTGIVPHVGGPILPPCAPTVLTGAMPQARILDMVTCIGPPDMIAKGSATVLMGGMPAARMFDLTQHGGVIVLGWPTVLIGDAGGGSVTLKVAPGSSPAFVDSLRSALTTLFATPSGAAWLRQMGKNGRTVTFEETGDDNGYARATDVAHRASPPGSDSVISWNPNKNALDPSRPGTQGAPGAAVILAHEMCHALHNANGDYRNGPDDGYPGQRGTSARNEERSTVGTSGPITRPDGTVDNHAPDYSHDVPTENSFRDDLGIPRRPSYYPQNWPGGAPW